MSATELKALRRYIQAVHALEAACLAEKAAVKARVGHTGGYQFSASARAAHADQQDRATRAKLDTAVNTAVNAREKLEHRVAALRRTLPADLR